MLTESEVDHIAKLARIELTPALRGRMQRDLSSILDYIELLKGVDTSGIEPLYQVTGLENRTRADEVRADFPRDALQTEVLINQAPHHEGRFLKVQSVKAK
jgi:aspartyl-tRNA(Asn)/glutamyl-tRNA(Gln) amidotransferase subunit C